MHKGSCLCQAIKIEVVGDLPPATACHCTMCRKQTGHFEAGVEVDRTALTVHGADKVSWFYSSKNVRRGFCSICGSALFFDPIDQEKHKWIGVFMGAFDGPTNTKLSRHIFVANKGDYYEITDGLPQNQQ